MILPGNPVGESFSKPKKTQPRFDREGGGEGMKLFIVKRQQGKSCFCERDQCYQSRGSVVTTRTRSLSGTEGQTTANSTSPQKSDRSPFITYSGPLDHEPIQSTGHPGRTGALGAVASFSRWKAVGSQPDAAFSSVLLPACPRTHREIPTRMRDPLLAEQRLGDGKALRTRQLLCF